MTIEEGEVPNGIIIPDYYMLDDYKTSNGIYRHSRTRDVIKWEDKIEVAFWRGSSTGDVVRGDMSIEEIIKRNDRFKLASESMKHPDLIDARICRYLQIEGDLSKIYDHFGIANHVPHGDLIKYKYLINVDGNGCSWLRLPYIMYTGSVLFKQETKKKQWFYKHMIPYVHYVPVKKDFSDLAEKIVWAKNNDQLCKNISLNARKFFDDHLTRFHMYEFLINTIRIYSLNFDYEIKPEGKVFGQGAYYQGLDKF
jgi:hypothetical protein